MTKDDTIMRLIASSERLYEAALLVTKWAKRWPVHELPPELVALIDAARDYQDHMTDFGGKKDEPGMD